MKENPFSFYDFLGYLIPGGVFLYILYFVFKVDIVLYFTSLDKKIDHNLENEILFFIPAIIFAYVTGHVFSLLSSFFIEKFSVYLYGYPSKYLFTEKHKIHLLPKSKKEVIGAIGRILLFIFLLPVSTILFALKLLHIPFFEQAKTLQKDLGNVVFEKCIMVLDKNLKIQTESISAKKETDGLGDDYFRIIYHFIFENSEKHSSKLQNYVALYGFCRNISFVFLVNSWLSLYFPIALKGNKFYFTMIFSLLTFLFFIGFVKFYRRYTLEALMGTTVFNKY